MHRLSCCKGGAHGAHAPRQQQQLQLQQRLQWPTSQSHSLGVGCLQFAGVDQLGQALQQRRQLLAVLLHPPPHIEALDLLGRGGGEGVEEDQGGVGRQRAAEKVAQAAVEPWPALPAPKSTSTAPCFPKPPPPPPGCPGRPTAATRRAATCHSAPHTPPAGRPQPARRTGGWRMRRPRRPGRDGGGHGTWHDPAQTAQVGCGCE